MRAEIVPYKTGVGNTTNGVSPDLLSEYLIYNLRE